MSVALDILAIRFDVRGFVQGVGFRPFVYRLAVECQLTGGVHNDGTGVVIEAEGTPLHLREFESRLFRELPPGAHIEGCHSRTMAPTGAVSFQIDTSLEEAAASVRVPQDRRVCEECLAEVMTRADRRWGYALATCMNCGPRYSLIESMPYDRAETSMNEFRMCDTCRREYSSPDDRRFHAQPIACWSCGPRPRLLDPAGRLCGSDALALERAKTILRSGKILAVKGVGGFQLMVRADDEQSVARLRERKARPTKPFALMVALLEWAKNLAHVSPVEEALLDSSNNPIVLLSRRANIPVAVNVAPNTNLLGLCLPTTPMHHLLMNGLEFCVVATSGNAVGEPIALTTDEATKSLGPIADAFLVHDRPIVRRVDDSVARVIDARLCMFRSARGYAPTPLRNLESWIAKLPSSPRPVLALGGQQKVSLAAWTGKQAVLGQHIGDLESASTRDAFGSSVSDLTRLYQFEPDTFACDEHPDYFSTHWAGDSGKPVERIQHHHAHAVSVMVEHDLLDREVLAFTWDGTGLGPDGTIWGGEALRVTLQGFSRVSSPRPFPLVGGEAAIRSPNRIAFALLWEALGESLFTRPAILDRLGLSRERAVTLIRILQSGIRVPLTTSVGRIFDGIAALLVGAHKVTYEGEAAMRLEAVANCRVSDSFPVSLDERLRWDWHPLLEQCLEGFLGGEDVGTLAAKFHNTLAEWATAVARRQDLEDVVLTGGCFQNRLLAEKTATALRREGLRPYLNSTIPPNDGGLSVGQLAVALARQSRKLEEGQ